MCGVAAGINCNLWKITDEQKHRGPDAGATTGVLGHRLLSIIGSVLQPLHSAKYELAANCEIYNYDRSFPNDAEWLLHLIDKYGVHGSLTHITGMFAFACQDKIENKFYLCVDRLGEKPLYYYHDGDVFAAASSPHALLHLKPKWKINKHALQSYWKLGAVMEDSIWEGIKRVYASELVTYDINTQTITTERYWQPSYRTNHNDLPDLIRHSIDLVKVADVPIHILLSGGIDSTLVASRFKGGNAVHLNGPERKYAEQVAGAYDIRLRVVDPPAFDPVTALTDYVSKCGEPTMAGLIPWIVCNELSKFGRVGISANGGDELFFGYDRTTNDRSLPQLKHLFREGIDYDVLTLDPIDDRLSSGRWLELMTYVQHDLNRTLDFASMAHSVEVRSPFLNHELVELALSMTPEQIGRKMVLKRMLGQEGWNPDFLHRPKQGFSLYRQPEGLGDLQAKAFDWCRSNGYLNPLYGLPSRRDLQYLSAAAFGFKVWYDHYKHIIE